QLSSGSSKLPPMPLRHCPNGRAFPSITVGDEKLLGREEGDHPTAGISDHHFLLDPRGGMAIARGAIRLQREDHPFLNLNRPVERDQPTDDRPFVESEAETVPELERESLHLACESELLGLRPTGGELVGGDPRLDQTNRRVHPLTRLFVRVLLRL